MSDITTTIDPNQNILYNQYGYTPSHSANMFFAVMWGILTVAQIVLAVPTHELFYGVSMTIGCILELIGFIGRVMGNHDPYDLGNYMMNTIGTIIGPVFFMADVSSFVWTSSRLSFKLQEVVRLVDQMKKLQNKVLISCWVV
ncbi:unnamed protein product [Ambrosiozyma monospora]|uniref:Unnamed protein product n=1 Tax=Ambrosiozyma monospora TaxID=43982 RepID=A0ACB5U450_AMBMO|nr:unnamed protein product [Ambrosiozyma monospora]